MPATPMSQPLITSPRPRPNRNGLPSLAASKIYLHYPPYKKQKSRIILSNIIDFANYKLFKDK